VTPAPTAWLPGEVVERPAAQAPFDQALDAWRAAWTPGLALKIGGWTLRSGASIDPRASPEGDAWRRPRGVVAISCSLRARLRLASAALDLDLDAGQANERDRAVLNGFCTRLLDDLAARFEAVLGEAAATPAAMPAAVSAADSMGEDPAAARIFASVEGEAGVLVHITLPAPPVAALYRRTLPRPPAATLPLQGRLKALAASDVRLEATLGEAALSLPELRAMAVGDVLRLDRKLTEPGRLNLAAGGFVANGLLTHAEGRLALRLTQDSATGTR
jgi:flagellar motor switch/type III secretory pathway protein FliN